MRATVIVILVCIGQTFALGTYSQNTRLNINLSNVAVEQVLGAIEDQSEFYFMYESKKINADRKVTLNCTNKKVDDVLTELFEGTGVTYKINNRQIALTSEYSVAEVQQTSKVSGKVSDSSGSPMPGVSVVVKGTNNGTITDGNGNYSLSNLPSNATLQFSFIGMKSQEIAVENNSTINVALAEETIGIEEVVAIGYGTARKSDMTGSVSSVSSTKFAEQNLTRIDQILQGRASGVVVTANSGAPGGESKIRIRGSNSALGSNDPLYVVDGYVGADYNMINPNDIESIEVLKDASSTAIYGSRGSNGVIIITTKGGKKGKLAVNYQGGISVSNIIATVPVLNAADFATVVNERNTALGQNLTFTSDQINTFKQTGGTNWQNEIYRQAVSKEHQLGISGATEKTTFLVSTNYLDQPGIIENTSYKRYTMRSNMTTQFNDKLSFRMNITGANMMNLNNQIRQGATSNPNVQAITWAPTTPIYDANGNYTISDPTNSLKPNPLALIYDQEGKSETTFGNIVGGLKYEFVKGLALDVQYAVNFLTRNSKAFSGNYVTNFAPNASINNTQQVTLQNTNTLSFNRTINDIHKINAVAVFETQEFKGNYSGSSAAMLKFPALKYDNLSQAGSFAATSSFTKWTLMSFLGRVNYSLKDKYLLSVSVRRDGSSKFSGDNKFSTFPAAALGWNMAEEGLIKDLNLFSKLKLRGSWGFTGSQAIEPYATQSAYRNVIYAFDNTTLTSGIQLGNPGNKDLKWETTEQKDIGLEVGFLGGRLNAEFDYFVKNTTDLLLNRSLPGYMGGGVMTSNVGEIKNKGWELTIGGTILKAKDFSWESDFNITDVRNEVVSLGGISKQIFTSTSGTNTTGTNKIPEFVYQPGSPLGSYWGLKYLGTWKPNEAAEAAKYSNVPGDARYEDDGDFIIGASDYKIIGYGMPTTSAGWNNTVNHKNFTLNFFFQGIFGADKLNYSRAAGYGSMDTRQPSITEIKDRYIPGVNETSQIPAFSKTSKIIPQSTMFMESGDFIRLKNLSLSYILPKSILPNIGGVKLSVQATNLFTITKYKGLDPESSSWGSGTDLFQGADYGSYPNARTYTLGLSITL